MTGLTKSASLPGFRPGGTVLVAVAMSASAQEYQKMTETSPTQVVQIQRQIELLKAQTGESLVLTIQEVGGPAIIQLSKTAFGGKTIWSLNIGHYPSKDKPAKAFAAAGMGVPAAWREEGFKAGVYVQYGLPESDLAALPQFIHDLFVKFFKRPPTYVLDCSIENM